MPAHAERAPAAQRAAWEKLWRILLSPPKQPAAGEDQSPAAVDGTGQPPSSPHSTPAQGAA